MNDELDIDRQRVAASIEAVLFCMGGSVKISDLEKALDVDADEIKGILESMESAYAKNDRGICLRFFEDSVSLCTKTEFYDVLIKVAAKPQKPVLSDTVMETLTIVAYKQPVTKGEIERIRGVKSDFAVNKLVEYGLIEEVGRLDAPGRPTLFATTEEFLRRFGLDGVGALPAVPPDEIARLETQARDEIPV